MRHPHPVAAQALRLRGARRVRRVRGAVPHQGRGRLGPGDVERGAVLRRMLRRRRDAVGSGAALVASRRASQVFVRRRGESGPPTLDDLKRAETLRREESDSYSARARAGLSLPAKRGPSSPLLSLTCLECLPRRLAPARADRLGTHAFDKDDGDAMRFVAAAANLRSRIFHIDPKSLYECKGIAGNIIPAIATTNAIVAGLQVTELLKLVKEGCVLGDASAPRRSCADVCKYTYCLKDQTRKGLLLQPTQLEEPQSACYVCRAGKVAVALDTETTVLSHFVDVVLKRKQGAQGGAKG